AAHCLKFGCLKHGCFNQAPMDGFMATEISSGGPLNPA
ncbi:MAG: hypothetical protein ACI9DO_003412, partial [Reinekea sp.]